MKFFLIIGLFLAVGLSSSAQDQLVVDANASIRELTESFDKIVVSTNVKLIISQGDAIALAVSASEEKYKDEIKTVVKNGTLNIYITGSLKWNNKSRNHTVYLSIKDILSVNVSGASEVIALGVLTLNNCEINLSGASRFTAGFAAAQLIFDLSGASKANCKGNVKQVNIECSGASDMNGFFLYVEKANLQASGASDIRIAVSKEVNAEASGASHIYYKGKAGVTNVKASGVSKIINTD